MKKLSKEEMKIVIGGDDIQELEEDDGSVGWCSNNPYDEGISCRFDSGPCAHLRGHCHHGRCVGGC